MPWDCPNCASVANPDTASDCRECGHQKSAWTVDVQVTRVFKLGRKRLEVLYGKGDAWRPRQANVVGELVTARWAPVMAKRRAAELAAQGQFPGLRHMLVARVHPSSDKDREVILEVDFSREDLAEHEIDAGDLPMIGNAFFDVPILLVHGEGEVPSFPGMFVYDVTEGTETGFAPAIEVQWSKMFVDLPTRAVVTTEFDLLEVQSGQPLAEVGVTVRMPDGVEEERVADGVGRVVVGELPPGSTYAVVGIA